MAMNFTFNHDHNKFGNRHIAIFGVAVLCLALLVAKLYAGPILPEDARLFGEKCGRCHGWQKPIRAFSGPLGKQRKEIIIEMSNKIPGFVSDAQRERIILLLSQKDLNQVAAVVEKVYKPKNSPGREMIRRIISAVHGGLMALLFLTLGVYMTLSGLKRFFIEIKKFKGFPAKFNRRDHIRNGKVFIVLAAAGFLFGAEILYLSHFHPGPAIFHLFAAIVILILYAIGGITGLKLAKIKGKAPSGLKNTHLVCNVTATLLFIFNIASGIALALSVLN
jgi:hypothetical protein